MSFIIQHSNTSTPKKFFPRSSTPKRVIKYKPLQTSTTLGLQENRTAKRSTTKRNQLNKMLKRKFTLIKKCWKSKNLIFKPSRNSNLIVSDEAFTSKRLADRKSFPSPEKNRFNQYVIVYCPTIKSIDMNRLLVDNSSDYIVWNI